MMVSLNPNFDPKKPHFELYLLIGMSVGKNFGGFLVLPLWVKNWRMFGRNRRNQVRNVYC